ncbi:hypothetical protein RRG08_038299 [Elysia crispata]|uniref:Uncharacterized protein n=1 Tax=Elysia crispata TaxID=231223 RepID=A0AAE1AN75_9GAST|nr:hypothetical protein RRG08_038299 [Elysia crispata]
MVQCGDKRVASSGNAGYHRPMERKLIMQGDNCSNYQVTWLKLRVSQKPGLAALPETSALDNDGGAAGLESLQNQVLGRDRGLKWRGLESSSRPRQGLEMAGVRIKFSPETGLEMAGVRIKFSAETGAVI